MSEPEDLEFVAEMIVGQALNPIKDCECCIDDRCEDLGYCLFPPIRPILGPVHPKT